MVDVQGALTRKIGPLPAWGWGVAVGGGLLAVKMARGGGSGTQKTVIEVPTGAPYPADELSSQLGEALLALRDRVDDLSQRVTNNQDNAAHVPAPKVPAPSSNTPKSQTPPTIMLPKGVDIGTLLMGLRSRFRKPASVATAGETAAQRRSRLNAELASYGTSGKFDLGTYLIGLRKQYPKIATLWTRKPAANETPTQRLERLRAELKFFASKGIGPASQVVMTPTAA